MLSCAQVQTMAHALDVERQRATLEALEADVREEAGINQVDALCIAATTRRLSQCNEADHS